VLMASVVVTALAAVDEDARAEGSRGPMCHRRPAHFSTRSRVNGHSRRALESRVETPSSMRSPQ
jgi:hypothetical protein